MIGPIALGALWFVTSAARAQAAPSTAGVEFFESRIRPILAANCYECHSHRASKVKGGLLLDSRDDLRRGGNTSAAIAPGNPDGSLLIRAVRRTDKAIQMPPGDRRLTDVQIKDLEMWVRLGAPDPRDPSSAEPANLDSIAGKAQKHWAFQPIRMPAMPGTAGARVATPVDAFVLAELSKRGLQPSPEADRHALIRRATYDLTGLPPTIDEVNAFCSDPSPDAYEHLVDRLLASPRYGERWGRHWLDVARYSDSAGYTGGESEKRYFYAWTYRDWVIRAINADMPIDQFLLAQMAADQLPMEPAKRPLAALGFLTVGKRYLNNRDDIIDDRMDVVCRGLMGLTVGCARCHDHKYDPIPTRDYYSLYGVFLNSAEPKEQTDLPEIPGDVSPTLSADFREALARSQSAYQSTKDSVDDTILSKLRHQTGQYLFAALRARRIALPVEQGQFALERKLDVSLMRRWQEFLRPRPGVEDRIFWPLLRLAEIPDESFAPVARAMQWELASKESLADLNPIILRDVFGTPPRSLEEACNRYGDVFNRIDDAWDILNAEAADQPGVPGPVAMASPDEESLRQVLFAPGAPAVLDRRDMERFYERPTKRHIHQLARELSDVIADHPGSPPRAMALADAPKMEASFVLLKGERDRRGAETPRQFLEFLSGSGSAPFPANVSGRLQLARAVVSGDNPLTARVLVNRVWQQHFGLGLVRTPSDFGLRADPPSHPELLDYLSRRFIDDGWSLKKLHRLIMLSATYRQTCAPNVTAAAVDPDNHWLWRMNRIRLDYESLRDSLLFASGKLDTTQYGRGVDLATEPFSTRRSVWGTVDRLNFPEVFRAFDMPNPDKTISERPMTTVPQAALFMMNSEFAVERAKDLSARSANASADPAARITALYALAYQRAPSAEELEAGIGFVRAAQAENAAAPAAHPVATGWQYGSGYAVHFRSFDRFADGSWFSATGAGRSIKLTSQGGSASGDEPVTRRWIAPRGGVVRVSGTLSTPTLVRGQIVSSLAGTLGDWSVDGSWRARTDLDRLEVKKGETLDFVATAPAGPAMVSFGWAPQVDYIEEDDPASMRHLWDAARDFRGLPEPLDPWVSYAQVLCMTNEFAYDN